MSAIEARHAQGAKVDGVNPPPSQRHDRISLRAGVDDGDDGSEDEISGGQKMLSAVSGSLLTSILGTLTYYLPVTPLKYR